MIKTVIVQTLAALVAVVIVSLLTGYGGMAVSIALGGIVGLLNFIFQSRSTSGLLNAEGIAPVMLIFNMVRLILVMGVIFVLIYLKLAQVLGLTIGLTVSFLVVIQAGYFGSAKKS